MGPAAGGAVYSPALTDFVIMVDKTSHMFVTGPDVIKTVTGEDVGFEELGGALTLNTISPDSPNQPYDVKTVIEHLVDNADFLEVQPLYAPNIVVGFARVEGRSVGIIANQPNAMAGTLHIE